MSFFRRDNDDMRTPFLSPSPASPAASRGSAASPGSAASSPGYAAPASPGYAAPASPGYAPASPGYAPAYFDGDISTEIRWNITQPEIEKAIVEEVNEFERRPTLNLSGRNNIGDRSLDAMTVLKDIQRNQKINEMFHRYGYNDKKQNENIILQILDEIIYHRSGVSANQMREIQTSLEGLKSAEANATSGFFGKVKKFSPENRKRSENIGRLEKLTTENEKTKRLLTNDSFTSRITKHKERERLIVYSLRQGEFPENNSFCGVASLGDVSQGIADAQGIEFELNITGTGDILSDSSLRLSILDDVRPETEANIINALYIYMSGTNVNTNGVEITSLQPKPTGCLKCGCSILGGAKKIKRTRQSKKKKARRSKLKSKRVRRKNKSRRN